MTSNNQNTNQVVKVVKSQGSGEVLNISQKNPGMGWIMLYDTNNKRTGFLRGYLDFLRNVDLAATFKDLTAEGINCTGLDVLQPKGIVEGQLMPGRVVFRDSLTPIIEDTEFAIYIPNIIEQFLITPQRYMACREFLVREGINYMSGSSIMYRSCPYSPYPNGHSKYLPDILITPDNLNEVNSILTKSIY